MNDENDKPKSGDWGMTMPHLRFDKDKNAADFSDEFKPNPYSANQPQADDWGMTRQNFNQPSSDFDKTTPNINIPKNVRQNENPPSYDQSSPDGWEMMSPNADIPLEDKQGDWEMTAPKISVPKQDKQDDWSMPAPVFRVSEGEKVDSLPKRTLNFNRTEADDYDKTTTNFNLSELSPPYPYGSGSANIDSPPPGIPATIRVNQTAAAMPKTEKASDSKLIYVLVGLVLMLFFAIVVLVGAYFLFLSNRFD